MKRILFILSFVCVVFQANSQIIDSTHFEFTTCNNSTYNYEGYVKIFSNIPSPSLWYAWQRDSSGTWVTDTVWFAVDSMGFDEIGNYRVIVIDFLTSDTNYFYYDVTPLERILHGGTWPIQCHGDSTGEITLAFEGGVPFINSLGQPYYNYQWYKDGDSLLSGQNDIMHINSLYNGLGIKRVPYSLHLTDSVGCTLNYIGKIDTFTSVTTGADSLVIDTLFLFQQDSFKIDILKIDSVGCRGTNTASVKVNVKGAKRFKSGNYYDLYLEDSNSNIVGKIDRNGPSSNVVSDTTPYYVLFKNLGVGDYILHVVDSFGCTAVSDTITISEPDSLKLYASYDSTAAFLCEQDSTWIKIDSVSGGHQNYLEYYWVLSPSSIDSTFKLSGTYSAVILDIVHGCNDTLDFTFTAPNTIYCDVDSTPVECFGDSTGSLQIDSIWGGTPPYSVQWGGIDTNNLSEGTYPLIISDALNCIYTEDYKVIENDDVNLNETISYPTCFGASDGRIDINLTGGTSPYTVSWTGPNGFSSTDTSGIINLMADTFFLETIDDLSCIFLDTIVVSEPDSLSINFGGDTSIFCNGGQTLINATVNGGSPAYTYNWIDENQDTISNSFQMIATAGEYTLHVMDINLCFDSSSILITEPPLLEIIDIDFVEGTCNVGSTVSVEVTGGTLPYRYTWYELSDSIQIIGIDSSNISDLSEGEYLLVVRDTCSDTIIEYYFEVEAYILETTVYHYNDPDNVAEVEVSSGVPPYSYEWYFVDDAGDTIKAGETDSIEDLCDYWYYCITTDSNNCRDTAGILAELYFPNGRNVDFPNGSIINRSNTTVYDYPWGTEIAEYFWDNNDRTAKGYICPGFHRVWVTDVNGCELLDSVTVKDISLTLSPDFDTVKCDITNLEVELEVVQIEGGTGDYTYLWSNGQTEKKISVDINPGVYSVTVTDENSCKQDSVFNVAVMSSDCIPNVFSPNDDGSNDVWNLEDAFFYADSKVKVFNRYGKLVFKSLDNTPWDGKNQSGNDVQDGAYFYVIDLGNDLKKIKGTVTIIR